MVLSFRKSFFSFKEDRSGLAFPLISVFVVIVLFILFLIFVSSSFEEVSINQKGYFSRLSSVDEKIMLSESEEFYLSNKLDFISKKIDYLILKSLSSAFFGVSDSSMADNNSSSEFVIDSCIYNGFPVWYNDMLNSVSKKNNVSGNVVKFNKEYGKCIPNFDELDKDYLDFVKSLFEESFPDSIVNVIRSKKESNSNNDYLIVNIRKSLNFSNLISESDSQKKISSVSISKDIVLSKKIKVSDLPLLLKRVEAFLKEISSVYKKDVPICVNNGDKSELECMEDIFNQNVLKGTNFLNKYRFNVEYVSKISKLSEGKFYGLKVSLVSLKDNSVLLSFVLILKDNIPYSPLKFSLKNYDALNNVVEVDILKPSYSDSVKNYLLIYSYDNFLSERFSKFNSLINALENGEIPVNLFFDSYMIDQDNNKYFYSKDLGVTVMLSNPGPFVQDGGAKHRKILVYQIFNPDSNKFELLNKPIYLYVFAVDSNYNLFINDIKNKAKHIELKSVVGPKPLMPNEVSLTGEIVNYEKSLFLKINKYDDLFDHFNIYVFNENEKEFSLKNCRSDSNCYFYDGSGVLTKSKFSEKDVFAFLFSSLSSVKFPNVVYSFQFKPQFIFENGKKYSMAIVPVSKDGLGILQDISVQSFKVKDESSNFMVINKGYVHFSPLIVKGVEIVDKKGPTIDDIELGDLILRNGILYLTWESKVKGNIKELSFSMVIKTESGQTIGPTLINVGLDGRVITLKNEYKRIELTDLKIIDSSGNIGVVPNIIRVYPKVSN